MFRIVVVEDEATVRRGLVMTTPWTEYNCKVIGEAQNGEEGLEIITRLKPDIVITDIKMPKLDGLSMIERVLEEQECVFVVLTAFNDFDFAHHALKLGAADYLLKPFRDEDLSIALSNAKRMVESLKTLREQSQSNQKELSFAIDRYLSKSTNSKHKNIIRILEHIHDNFSEDLNLADTAEMLSVSESYLSRLFREETSYSFHEYLTVYRMKQACILLSDPNIKIYEVSDAVGYRNQRYFSIVFKKYMGMNPKEYKETLPKE